VSFSSSVWIITRASSGNGTTLAIHALKVGHRVIATARNPSTADSYASISTLGGKWISLDVTSPDTPSTIQDAAKIYGRLDVVVNNAGYLVLGAVEDISYVCLPSQVPFKKETRFR
jgi:NADP-dependent 3-hydroxy acid dehydrogenase YdfG